MTEEKATTLKSLEKRVNKLEDVLWMVAEAAILALKTQRYAEPQAFAGEYEKLIADAKRSQS